MARARNIKPGFFKNEQLVELPFEARLLFAGLWTLADREGRMEDRPKKIKMELFPADQVDVCEMLTQLQKSGFIARYETEGRKYIQCLNFKKHQNPHVKEPASTIPAPDEHQISNCTCTVQEQDEQQTSHADSLLPITDSPSLKKNTVRKNPDDAIEVLNFLNLKANRAYRPVEANVSMIHARLAEGFTVAELKQVIAKKCREWINKDEMAEFVRPKTLFSRTNFANYAGELVDAP